MIYIDRSSVSVPEVLRSEKIERELSKLSDLLSQGEEHIEQLRFKSINEYLQTESDLVKLFHGKCAYCESPIVGYNRSNVDHFRPKHRAEDLEGRIDSPHYSWLAYDWDNLLLVCELCIQPHRENGKRMGKGRLFPVASRRAPYFASVTECRKIENALLIDPCFDQPEKHLDFDYNGLCKALSRRGEVTIDVIGLNRLNLIMARQQIWRRTFSHLHSFFSDQSLTSMKRVDRLEELKADNRPYAATARAAIKYILGALTSRFGVDPTSGEFEKLASEDITNFFDILYRESALLATFPPESDSTRDIQPAKQRFRARRELPEHAHDPVSHIEIRNFKAIKSLDLEVPTRMADDQEKAGSLMLLGENATGKSTILEALSMTLIGTGELERLKLLPSEFIHRSDWEKPLGEEEATSVVVTLQSGAQLELHIDPKSPRFAGIERPATVLLGYGPRRFFPKKRRLRRSDHPGERLRTMFESLALVPNPRAWLMNCQKWKFNATIRALREILLLPEEALVTRPKRGERRGKQLMFEIQGDIAPLDRLSDGYKTIVATSVDIMREMLDYYEDLESACGIVLIDELETHLHPRWKMRIARSMREAMPNVQFLFTSHDPVCLRGMKNGEVQVMYRGDTSIDYISELPNVEGLSVEQLLTSDYFGLHSAEDPDLEIEMARYASLLAKGERTNVEEREISEHREQLRQTMTRGDTPQEQVIHEVMSEFTFQRATSKPPERKELKEKTVREILDLWASIDAGDIEP